MNLPQNAKLESRRVIIRLASGEKDVKWKYYDPHYSWVLPNDQSFENACLKHVVDGYELFAQVAVPKCSTVNVVLGRIEILKLQEQ